ncbi:MAG TPA: TIGR02588 family protein [Roseomonas sp.]|nr:TIGR02588 family protein [Roseomonas sp.]
MRKPALEWICAALGTVIVLATLAVVAAQIPGDDEAPPDIRLRVESVRPAGEGYLVRFEATNMAQSTAATVEIEGRLEEGGRSVEVSRVQLDYVPRGSRQRGGLWFTRDPAQYRLSLRVLGYQEP